MISFHPEILPNIYNFNAYVDTIYPWTTKTHGQIMNVLVSKNIGVMTSKQMKEQWVQRLLAGFLPSTVPFIYQDFTASLAVFGSCLTIHHGSLGATQLDRHK